MARTPKRSTVKNNLDKVTPQIIKLRDEQICQRCLKYCSGQGCHWSHVYSRTRYSMRWDLLNAIVLCAGCHQWWHDNPVDSGTWFAEKWPHREAYLQGKKLEPIHPIYTSELIKWLEAHKLKLKQLEKGQG